MTTAGQLFVSLGMKGADKSLSDLLGLKKGLEDTKAVGLGIQSVFANMGIIGTEKSVASILELEKAFEDMQSAAAKAKAESDWQKAFGGPKPDSIKGLEKGLNDIRDASHEAGAALGQVKPKDPEKTKEQLEQSNKGLKNTASLAFEAKAAIFGAMYALEQLFSTSSQQGTSLVNFNAETGVSMKTLQQYQYAARQVGVSNEEMAGTFASLQNTMTKITLNKGVPEGLAQVSRYTGMSPADIKRFADKPQELIQILQKYAALEKNVGLRNYVLGTFGIQGNMLGALARGAFTPDILAKAPTYSDNEAKNLDKVRAQIANLKNQIEMAIGHFTSAHGGQLVGDISKMVMQVEQLVAAFAKLAEQAKIFEWIGKIFGGWTMILNGATTAVDALNDPKKKKTLADQAEAFLTNDLPNMFRSMLEESIGPAPQGRPSVGQTPNLKLVAPPAPTTGASNHPQNVEFNQTLNFGDNADPKKVGDASLKAIRDAWQQSPARSRSN